MRVLIGILGGSCSGVRHITAGILVILGILCVRVRVCGGWCGPGAGSVGERILGRREHGDLVLRERLLRHEDLRACAFASGEEEACSGAASDYNEYWKKVHMRSMRRMISIETDTHGK